MFSFRNKKGFTLIEMVLVLVLMGILAAVALTKYYDLKAQAEYGAACAHAKQFAADFNNKVAELVLAGKSCAEAQDEAYVEVGGEYLRKPNSNGMFIGPLAKPGTSTYGNVSTVVVFLDYGYGSTVRVPSGLVACENRITYDPEQPPSP